jgi:segregation and condensation protein A
MTNAKPYDVHLDIFEGPLDLLLYLIRKSDLDIYDIPISQITSEYLAYIDLLKEMSLDVAGEFLVMASTLMQIKAHTLLPAPNAEAEEGPDPRAELINRLLEYQRYKEAAKDLHGRLEANRDIFYRGTPVFSENDYHMDASLFDLLDAFRDVLSELKPEVREVLYEEIPMENKIREILAYMDERPYVTFRELLHLATNRHGLIVTFLAILELIRLKQVAARQVQNFGEIRVYKVEEGKEIPPVIEEMTAASQLMAPAVPSPMPEAAEPKPEMPSAEEAPQAVAPEAETSNSSEDTSPASETEAKIEDTGDRHGHEQP